MANHIREQILAAIETRLTDLTTSGDNVFRDSIYPMQADDLPGLRIDDGDEQAEEDTLSGTTLAYTLEVTIECCAKAVAGTLGTTLNTMAKEVQTAMASDRTFGGLAKDSWYSGSSRELESESEQPVGIRRLRYTFEYRTTAAAPDVAA